MVNLDAQQIALGAILALITIPSSKSVEEDKSRRNAIRHDSSAQQLNAEPSEQKPYKSILNRHEVL